MRVTGFFVTVLAVTAASSVAAAQAAPRQAGDPATKQLRVALLPFENRAGNAGDRINAQLAVATAKLAALPRARLVRIDGALGVTSRDPLATIGSRTKSALAVRGTITEAGGDIVLTADVVDPR